MGGREGTHGQLVTDGPTRSPSYATAAMLTGQAITGGPQYEDRTPICRAQLDLSTCTSDVARHIFAVELRYAQRLGGLPVSAWEDFRQETLDEIFEVGADARRLVGGFLAGASDEQMRETLTFATLTAGTKTLRFDTDANGVSLIDILGADGERGWVVPPGDHVRLADAIQNALEADIDWPAMRRRCREYSEQFTLENWTARIARMCASRWQCSYTSGKLKPAS